MHLFKYKLYCNSIVSEKEIAYDIRLEISRDEILNQIWFNEELQIQPKKFHNSIIKSKHDFL